MGELTMILRSIVALVLTTCGIAFAQVPTEQLAKPPVDGQVWTITSSGGKVRHGQVNLWTDSTGNHWSRMSMNLRGFVTEIDEQNRFEPDGSLESLTVRGTVPDGDAAESYVVKNGAFTYASPVDHGTGKTVPNLEYAAFGGTFDSFTFILDALLKSPNHLVNLLPSGRAAIEQLTTLEVSIGTQKKTLTAYALTGVGLSPFPVWMDGKRFFGIVGFLNFLPQGWESAADTMIEAQEAALSKRAPALLAALAKTPDGPVAFKKVRLYDADGRMFREGMTVVIDRGRVVDVGPAEQTKVPASAQVIDGTGKTLIPGLWDNHQHYGDDETGALLLANGITSVRDPGNQPEQLMARKQRIDQGQLLGTRIVPSLLIDAPGEYAAQVATVVRNQDEAIAAVRRAKQDGYFGIKLYGSLDPAWVQPMAAEAHKLGLRVHGHIPHGMRPLEAVQAGYDEITHINFVMMQAMPTDVVATSNGMNRFVGTGKYAKDVDLHSKAMSEYFDQLAAHHTAVDPTLVTFEDLYVPDRGSYPPADAPYADSLPPQLSRSFLSSALAPSPELSRKTMRASFAKLSAIIPELNRRHILILAGTDGIGFELIRELELYVQAGLKPEEALATATINPATAFGLSEQTGSLAKGKLAELALINGDPSQRIGDLRQVELVMRDGKIMEAQRMREALGISAPPKAP
jgi:cytosine/adenosine deaminase-related metal-dependent hydrolase